MIRENRAIWKSRENQQAGKARAAREAWKGESVSVCITRTSRLLKETRHKSVLGA